jgi:tetratricopeptide (TPR) repeat protein
LGSKADGKFVVVEKTPKAMNVREPEEDSIVSSNHFQTEKLKDDKRNLRYIEEATSIPRYERLSELLQTNRGTINATRAVAMLRDRLLPGGAFVGNGHRATLNALIATHATVMDLTDGIFWAALPPNQLGKFVAFDVNDFERELPTLTIAEDPLLTSGEFEKARVAQQALAETRTAFLKGEAEAALAAADKAERNNPGFYQNAALRGLALRALNRNAEAADAFRAALAAQPAFLSERQELEGILKQVEGAK